MKQRLILSLALATTLISCAGISSTPKTVTERIAQPESALRSEILRADSQMFEAFNAHDAGALANWFSRDLEFYHDTGGHLNHEQAMEGFRSNFARANGLRRVLLSSTVEVYPVKNYGAVETGSHRFCHTESGQEECGVFKV